MLNRPWTVFYAAFLLLPFLTGTAAAQEDVPKERLERLERLNTLIERIDPDAQRGPTGTVWNFEVEDRSVTVVTDPRADRMRIITPIAPQSILTPALTTRLLQANFDTALDARYAIARDIVWGTFIHPLTALSDEEFLSGLGQTVNIATTFGTTFQSGAITYGGGDSAAELGELLKELLTKKDEKPA